MSDKFDSECEVIIEDELEEGELSDKNIRQDAKNGRKKVVANKQGKLTNSKSSLQTNSQKIIPRAYQNRHKSPKSKTSERHENTTPPRQKKQIHSRNSTHLNHSRKSPKASVSRYHSKNKVSPEGLKRKSLNDSKLPVSKWPKLSLPNSSKKQKLPDYLRDRYSRLGITRYLEDNHEPSYDDLLKNYKMIRSKLAKLDRDDGNSDRRSKVVKLDRNDGNSERRSKLVKLDRDDGSSDRQSKVVKLDQEYGNSGKKSQSTVNGVIEIEDSNNKTLIKAMDIPASGSECVKSKSNIELVQPVKSDEDSELEQLRLQALASRANVSQPSKQECLTNGFQNVSNSDSTNKEDGSSLLVKKPLLVESLCQLKNVSSAFSVAEISDIHDVLDMDTGTDDALIEKRKAEADAKLDLEAATLRAKLLESLHQPKTKEVHAKSNKEETPPAVEPCVEIIQKESNNKLQEILPNIITAVVENNINLYEISKPVQKIFPSHPQRFIINLEDDSSSEEDSDTADSCESNPILASLERLINSARNESEVTPASKPHFEVDNAQKTEQEECKKLFKLLSEKDGTKEEQVASITNRRSYDIVVRRLKKVDAIIIDQKNTLKKVKTRSNESKAAFIKSQVKVQLLQKQLDEANQEMTVNKKAMFETNALLRNIQRCISNSQRIMIDLQTNCTQLSKQIFSENCFSSSATRKNFLCNVNPE